MDYLRQYSLDSFFNYEDYLGCTSAYLNKKISTTELIAKIKQKRNTLKYETRLMRTLVFYAFYRSISRIPYYAKQSNNYHSVMTCAINSLISRSRLANGQLLSPADSSRKELAMHGYIFVMFVEAEAIQNPANSIEKYTTQTLRGDQVSGNSRKPLMATARKGLQKLEIKGHGIDAGFVVECADYISAVCKQIYVNWSKHQRPSKHVRNAIPGQQEPYYWDKHLLNRVYNGKKTVSPPAPPFPPIF